MIRLPVLISCICLFAYSSLAQAFTCPFEEINCPGKCGLFCDTNADKYCDHSALLCVSLAKNDSISENKTIETTSKRKSENLKQEEINPKIIEESTDVETLNPADSPKINNQPVSKKNPYHPIPILLSMIGLYIGTYVLVRIKVLKMQTHRKIWNIALTLTFLVSGVLGLVLVFFIQYAYIPSYYLDFMASHVDFGVAMAAIALFHALWHLSYYKNIFKKIKSKQ
ncbi:MAG: hypothetical protein WC142_09440 [Bacteroidales bacterium]|jgi:hypothetical protein|nr:hypothetical protein [Bacteroidales bacterium]